jgi:hypothetical protein
MSEDTAEPVQMEMIPQPRMLILKIALVVMSILLVAGFAVVAITIVKRASDPQAAAAAKALSSGHFGVSDVQVAPGEMIKSFSMNEDRIAIHIAGSGGEEIILVSPRTGQEIGRIHLRQVTDFASSEQPSSDKY